MPTYQIPVIEKLSKFQNLITYYWEIVQALPIPEYFFDEMTELSEASYNAMTKEGTWPSFTELMSHYVDAWNYFSPGHLQISGVFADDVDYHRILLTQILENGAAIDDVAASLPATLDDNLILLNIVNVHTKINEDRAAINQLKTALAEAQTTINTLLAERRAQGIQDA